MLPMTIIIRNKRVVTYRRRGIPAIILEGKWLTALYRLRIGDIVDIEHQRPKGIYLKKNRELSKQRQQKLKEREERRKQLLEINQNSHMNINENQLSEK